MRTQLLLLQLLLLLGLTSAVHGQTFPPAPPDNNFPCEATDLNGATGDTAVTITANNISATSDTIFGSFAPVCVTNTNTVYFKYAVPAGYSNLTATLTTLDTQNVNMVFMRPTVCTSPPGMYIGSSVSCTAMDTDGDGVLVSTLATGCLDSDTVTWIFIRVAGQEGSFTLSVDVVQPTCSDGCKNGLEVGVDSVPPITISSLSGFDKICSGDTVILMANDTLDNYTWSTGDTTQTIIVTDIGIYTCTSTDIFGCVYQGLKIIRADTSCVWPGETNLDGRVNARDILPIGAAFDETGPIRDPMITSTDFIGQPSIAWGTTLVGVYAGVDIKNADCNGDGVVDQFDALVVQENYGGVVFFRPEALKTGDPLDPHLFIEFEEDILEAGDTLRAIIHLGDSITPVDSLYQYAFHLNFPSSLVDTSTLNISFDNSWLKIDSLQNLGFYKYLPASDFVDISYSRTNQLNKSGYGPILEMDIVVIDDLGGRLFADEILNFSFKEELFLKIKGDSVAIYPEEDSIVIKQFCNSVGLDSDSSYIYGIGFNQFKLPSLDNGGYLDTSITAGFLRQGNTYTFRAAPGYPGFPVGIGPATTMDWRVWADFNHDGFLKESDGELLIEQSSDTYISQVITIPMTTEIGITTFRYQMAISDVTTSIDPCSNIAYGEVEDWKIEIRQATSRTEDPGDFSSASNLGSLKLHPNPVASSTTSRLTYDATNDITTATISLTNLQGATVYQRHLPKLSTNHFEVELPVAKLPNGLYLVEVKTPTGTATGKLMIVH